LAAAEVALVKAARGLVGLSGVMALAIRTTQPGLEQSTNQSATV